MVLQKIKEKQFDKFTLIIVDIKAKSSSIITLIHLLDTSVTIDLDVIGQKPHLSELGKPAVYYT